MNSQESPAPTQPTPSLPPRLQRILVPLDFSENARKALRYAEAFARQFGARITLLHVVEPMIYPADSGFVPVETHSWEGALVKETQTRLEAVAREAIGPGVDVETVVVTGNAFMEIAELARARQIDLLIITTHGYTGLKHLLLGSTAERVVRHAPCPVMVVRQAQHDFV